MKRRNATWAALWGVAGVMFAAKPVSASIIPTPGTVTVFPTQTSPVVNLAITFPAAARAGTATVDLTGEPAGVTTLPSPVGFTFSPGATSASVSFQLVTTGATPPGTHAIGMALRPDIGAGTGTVTLVVREPSFAAASSPNPVMLTAGGGSQSITVATTPDPGFRSTITYSYSGFPAGLATGAAQAVGPPYSALTFPFSASLSVAAGTYNGTLTGQYTDPSTGASRTRGFPMAAVVQRPDLNVAFSQPAMTVCNGGAAVGNSATLSPVSGYSGRANLTFTGVPTGLTVSPPSATSGPIPPAYTQSFTVTASGAAIGLHTLTLNVADRTAGIDKNTTFTVRVVDPDYTPSASPSPLTIQAGGSSGGLSASLTANACFTAASVSVAPSGAPAGVTFTPATVTLTSPGYSPGNFSVAASRAVPPGTYSFTLTFTPTTGAVKRVPATLTITAPPDFSLSASPSSLTVSRGGTAGSVTVSADSIASFADAVSVTAATVATGVTISPASFSLSVPTGGSASRAMTIAAGSGAGLGTFAVTFTGDVPGVGARRATLNLTITAAPDNSLSVAPSTLTVTAGGTAGSVTVSSRAVNGFSGSVSVTAGTAAAGVTIAPSAFTLSASGTQAVTILASASAASGSFIVTFTGTAAGVGTRTGSLALTVAPPPDYSLGVAPSSLTIAPGGPGSGVMVTANSIAGFAGAVSMTASTAAAGVTLSPASFSLNIPAGGSQSQAVTITAGSAAPSGTFAVTFTGNVPGIGTRSATLNLTVTAAPDYSLSVGPSPLTLTPGGAAGNVTLSAIPFNGFSGPISVTATTAAAGVTVTPNIFSLPASGSQVVAISASASSLPGFFTLTFTGTATGIATRTAALSLTVAAAPDYSIEVPPSPVTLAPGGPGAAVTVSASSINNYSGPVTVTASTTAASITITPASFTIMVTPSSSGSQQVTIAAGSGAPTGIVNVTFIGDVPGIGTRSGIFTLTITSAPDYALSVSPPALALTAGGPVGAVTLSASAFNGFSGSISVTAGTVANGVTISPTAFTLPANGSQAVSITVSSSAAAGAFPVTFTGNAAGLGTRSSAFQLTIAPAPPARVLPVIAEVAPPAVARGARSMVLRLVGSNFQRGAIVLATAPDLTIEQTTVLSPTLAEVIVTARSDATVGPRRLDLRNPDGETTRDGAVVLVYPASSLTAPLGVTAAAIVFPRPGSLMAFDEALYPRGLLATTGTGIVVGSWLFDGAPFDRFTAVVTGGLPIEVRSRIPIPVSFAGGHRLELAIETPQRLVSAPVKVIQVVARSSGLLIYAPANGAVIGRRIPLFRWSLVPGASGYEVLLEGEPPALTKRFRLAEAEWRPSRRDLDQIGPGAHTWRVRAVFPGAVEGEPTPAQRFALLPEKVALKFLPAVKDPSTGRTLLRWEGGSVGLLYRLEFFQGEASAPVFSALSVKQEYLLPEGSPYGSSEYRARVSAYGPEGDVLGKSELQVPGSAFVRRVPRLQRARKPLEVSLREPPENAVVETDRPRIAARWNGVAPPETVALAIDTTDVTGACRVEPTSITCDAFLPISSGEHTVRLSLQGEVTAWTFTVGPQQPAETEKPGLRTDWAATVLGTLTVVPGNAPDQNDDARLQLSSQGDLGNEALSAKLTGDISFRHQISQPESTVQESRNWLFQAGAREGKFRQEGVVGFAAPSFLDQAELLTTGLAKGGVEARLFSPMANLFYYQTFDAKPAGVVTADSGEEQKVRLGALTTPGDPNRFFLRAIAMEVEDSPGLYSPGGKGEAFGLFGKWSLGPAFSVLFEAARGDFTPRAGSAEGEREGSAARLAILGTAGSFNYGVNVRLTEAEFVNPANRGFTPGGIADRRGGDLSLTKAFGRTSLALQVRHLEGGNSSGSVQPGAREDGGNLTLNTTIGQKVSVSASAQITADRADADLEHHLPETDRTQSGWTVTVNENPGAITFSQTYSNQRLRDDVNPSSDQTIQTASVNAAGALAPNLNLSALVSGTRSESIPDAGQTDQLLVSLQPSFAIPALWLSLQPRVAYNRSQNRVANLDSRGEQYQILLLWAPTWVGSLVNLQFFADWNRNRSKGQSGASPFTHRYAGTLTLRWGAGKGPAAPDQTALPGSTPIEPPREAAASPASEAVRTPRGGGS